jgi:Ca2+-binding EF-hand superfamily protein
MSKEISKSTSNLQEITYGGRPKGEEPHVIRKVKRKQEQIEYIVRVDLDELKIDDDNFEDLQSLYKLFDLDRDGILNFKEYEKLLRCLGYRLNEEAAQALAATVTVDTTNYSISFNEFLSFMSKQQEMEPDEETLVDVFTSFDKQNTGKISEKVFKQIMLGKDDINESDIEEMLEEYYRIAKLKGITSGPPSECGEEKPKTSKRSSKLLEENKDNDKYIDYKEFAAMLQQ